MPTAAEREHMRRMEYRDFFITTGVRALDDPGDDYPNYEEAMWEEEEDVWNDDEDIWERGMNDDETYEDAAYGHPHGSGHHHRGYYGGETTKVGLTTIVITMVTSAPRGITCIFRRKKTLHVKLVERSVIDKRSVQLVTPSKLEWLTRHIRRRARPIMRGKPEKLMENICVRPGIAATSEPNHHFILVMQTPMLLGLNGIGLGSIILARRFVEMGALMTETSEGMRRVSVQPQHVKHGIVALLPHRKTAGDRRLRITEKSLLRPESVRFGPGSSSSIM
ncbi:MAG: hypothetical protein FRX48_07677 [Lasallia pustulata]|uniref:Uncharacterized protein n=1 Tax=Lasallia pustulata TaxID=136370 RepID=A0A5M8PGZ3_9LECA|nr:MAG: hypothetical protein FRX48_07677 [Lasallia pustulata]